MLHYTTVHPQKLCFSVWFSNTAVCVGICHRHNQPLHTNNGWQ